MMGEVDAVDMVSEETTARRSVVAFAGGGTGGHLYPALAVAKEIRTRLPDVEFVFFGTDRTIDSTILDNAGCELVRQHLPPIRPAPWTWPATLMGIHRSSATCRALFAERRPLVVIGSGGLASVAPIREARRAGIPTVLFNPDAIPGKANRLLSGVADAVFVQWVDSLPHLSRARRVQVTGCPVRREFNEAKPQDGLSEFGLDAGRKTLLITGASQGARTINEAVIANLDLLDDSPDWQVLHLTGDRDYELVRGAYTGAMTKAKVVAYTHHMAAALAVADLVVSRAGASTLAEITAMGKPSILMPYPYHRDMHQLANAKCLARVGAARIVHDAKDVSLNGPALRAALDSLMRDDAHREEMAAAARRTGHGDAARTIATQVLALAWHRGATGPAESLQPTGETAR